MYAQTKEELWNFGEKRSERGLQDGSRVSFLGAWVKSDRGVCLCCAANWNVNLSASSFLPAPNLTSVKSFLAEHELH